MTAQNPPSFIQASSHPAEDVRRTALAWAMHKGVFGSADLAVTQRGAGANMSVDVAGGRVAIAGSEATYQGTYVCENRGTTNVIIAAADATNPRIDLIVAKVQDAAYSGATNSWSIVAVTGTPAASPAAPSAPNNSIVLARVAVAALAASITNANITDYRFITAGQFIAGPGPHVICQSTNRPTSPLFEGMSIYETDTNKTYMYNWSAWVQREDCFVVADSTARTNLASPYDGMRAYQVDNNRTYRYDGSSWWTVEIAAATTTAHTPQLDQGASTNITKNTTYSQYRIVDGVCEWWFVIGPTAAGTAGSVVTLTVPVAPDASQHGAFIGIGSGSIFDSSAGTIDAGQWIFQSSTQISLRVSEGGTASWGASPNLAIGNADGIWGHVRYLVASAA